jgi:hypothetical protein
MPVRYPTAAWIALGVVATAAWFVTATRLMRLWGFSDAAPAIGLIAAAIVALTLWRWAATDRLQRALAVLRCPRCAEAIETQHEHARPGGVETGLQSWTCQQCGYVHSEPLTCAECAV